MKYLELTLSTPTENLACDEALLDFCEEVGGVEILRLWEPKKYFVVVGYANKVNAEVHCDTCEKKNIPILRRCSGGGTVVQGPGCLNFSLILNFDANDSLQTITRANQFIMERHRQLFEKHLGTDVKIEGHTDLTIGGLKFSGNAQRRKKKFLLFHGAFLLDFDIAMIEQLLRMPSKEPDYRRHRSHEKFLINIPLQADRLKDELRRAWNSSEALKNVPQIPTHLIEKYRSREWNLKF